MASILVVDDDPDLRDLIVELLRGRGHRVREAVNGEEGLRLLQEDIPEVVVLDVEMPLLDGPGLAGQMLVHDCGLEAVPVVLCSGRPDLAAVAWEVGTPYVLPKPYSLGAFLDLVARALAERIPPRPRRASWDLSGPPSAVG